MSQEYQKKVHAGSDSFQLSSEADGLEQVSFLDFIAQKETAIGLSLG
jgi:hypothetical protein